MVTLYFLPIFSLLKREMLLFFCQKNRVIGAFLQPVMFWFIIGSGLNDSFRPSSLSGISYSEYFFPGILLLILLFTSIFSTIGVIEDRKNGFLQGVLVAPIPRSSIVLGKVLGGTLLGMIQTILLLPLAYTMDIHLNIGGSIRLITSMFLVGFALTSLSLSAAWLIHSIQGYHAIMSLFLFPLWIFSGALFPAEGSPLWMQWTMKANPLYHGLYLMRSGFYEVAPPTAPLIFAFSFIFFLCASTLAVSCWLVRRQQ